MNLASFVKKLPFEPLFFLKSPHLQSMCGYFMKTGKPPLSTPLIVQVDDQDSLYCESSTPSGWKPEERTIILVHGLTGSSHSKYIIRFSRFLYQKGYRVVRVNMRGCDPDQSLAKRPYHGGLTQDILHVLKNSKMQYPLSPITLVGFSISGNIVLKLAGELGEGANSLLEKTIAICPPVDLAKCSALLLHPKNQFYSRYFVKNLRKNPHPAIKNFHYSTVHEFDDRVISEIWGFKDAADYYKKCSSSFLLSQIAHPCYVLFAEDDPFIDYHIEIKEAPSRFVHLFATSHGGHLGFFGGSDAQHGLFWMNKMMNEWIENNENH